jgi:hypothetical protein
MFAKQRGCSRDKTTTKESGGPAMREPVSPGFGSTLIESAIPDGQVKREIRGDALLYVIEVPLPEPE